MKIVVVGSGGREAALAQVLARHHQVLVSPGNAGCPGSTAVAVEDLVSDASVDLVVIGPEQPLVDGLADRLRAQGVAVFGPGADGAQVEGSKAYMKDLAVAAGLPTARHGTFDNARDAEAFLRTLPGPWVVKTDGLAAGKGVLVAATIEAALADVNDKLSGSAFGDAGRTVIIEECLEGPEVSVFLVCDGHRAFALSAAQDFKRVGDGDTGPNTGGMGAWSPLPFLPQGFEDQVVREFAEPTLAELQRRGIDFRGVLYAGFMLTEAGPKLLEYNIRFGDPDSQVVLLRLTSDLGELLAAAAAGDLSSVPAPTFSDSTAVLVVAASQGYPVAPRLGDPIAGLEEAAALEGVTVLCAGVAADPAGDPTGDGRALVTAGGRVINVVGMGPDPTIARSRAYDALGRISWPGMHHRNDIAAG